MTHRSLPCRRSWSTALAAASMALLTVAAVSAVTIAAPARFTAFALDRTSGASAAVDVTVTRWSTEPEVRALASAFDRDGTPGLLRVLERTPRIGFLRVGTGLGTDVHFAQQVPQPGGGQLVIAICDRRLSEWETWDLSPSAQYPFAVVELRLDARGEGTGTFWPAARVSYWDLPSQTVIIDNYTQEPVDLKGVRRQRDRSQ